MGFQISCINHHGRLLTVLSGQPRHDPREDTPVAPPLPTVLERLVRAILSWGVTPPQTVAIDEDNAAQDPPVVDPGPAV